MTEEPYMKKVKEIEARAEKKSRAVINYHETAKTLLLELLKINFDVKANKNKPYELHVSKNGKEIKLTGNVCKDSKTVLRILNKG